MILYMRAPPCKAGGSYVRHNFSDKGRLFSMDGSRTMPRLTFICVAGVTLLGIILRTLSYLFCFDVDPGYFAAGLLPTLGNILYFVAVLGTVVLALCIPKGTLPTELHTRLRAPVSLALGISLLACSVTALILCTPQSKSRLPMAAALMGLLAALYYLLSAKKNGKYPTPIALLGYFPVLWSILCVAELYFDVHTTMNSPVKISLQLAFMGAMLMGLSELRFRVGRSLPRYSVAFWGIGSFTTLTGAVPLLIATGARILDNTTHLLYAVALLFMGLYGLYHMFRYTCSPSDIPVTADTAEAVSETDAPTPNAE